MDVTTTLTHDDEHAATAQNVHEYIKGTLDSQRQLSQTWTSFFIGCDCLQVPTSRFEFKVSISSARRARALGPAVDGRPCKCRCLVGASRSPLHTPADLHARVLVMAMGCLYVRWVPNIQRRRRLCIFQSRLNLCARIQAYTP